MYQSQIREVVRATMLRGKYMRHVHLLAVFEPLVTDGTAVLLPVAEAVGHAGY